MKAFFRQHYEEVVRPSLMSKMECSNILRIPRLDKVVINMGLGRRGQEKALLEMATEALSRISGQKPCVRRARKSNAAFKIREGMVLGLMVTLRGELRYEFLQKLINIAMPRIRDFRGFSQRSFDGHGNFSLGIKEYHVFPEIQYDKISDILGMDVTIVTTAQTDSDGKLLLQELGVPFYD